MAEETARSGWTTLLIPGSYFRRGPKCDSCESPGLEGVIFYAQSLVPEREGSESCATCGNTFNPVKAGYGPREYGPRVWVAPGPPQPANDAPTHSPTGASKDVLLRAGEHDAANGQRLVALFGQKLRFVHQLEWLHWDGRRWRMDTQGAVFELAKQTVQAIRDAAFLCKDDDTRKRLLKFADRSSNVQRLHGMMTAAHSIPAINLDVDVLDAHDDLLNVANGILHLPTGKLAAHDPTKYLTTLVDIAYDAAAPCPQWMQFLREACLGDEELMSYLQRCVGYTLTGYVTEHVLFFLFGDGRNGKSTFLNVVQRLLGEMSTMMSFDLLLASRESKTENALSSLKGKRMAIAIEPPEARSFNEEFLKLITGGEAKVRARYMYKDGFDFAPKFKIWLAGNDKPTIRGVNEGIWERFHLVPFQNHVPKTKRDRRLEQRLLQELPGILAWAVRGAMDWHKRGSLEPPRKVLDAVDEYRKDNDVIGRWIEECCTVREDLQAPAGELLVAANVYCTQQKERELTAAMLGRRLAKFRAGILKREKQGTGIVVWRGIGVGRDLPKPEQQTLGAAPPAPTAAQHDRLSGVLELIRRISSTDPKGIATETHLEAELALQGWRPHDVQAALDTLRRNNAIYCRLGAGTYAPMVS